MLVALVLGSVVVHNYTIYMVPCEKPLTQLRIRTAYNRPGLTIEIKQDEPLRQDKQ